jgi:hypothetical protein
MTTRSSLLAREAGNECVLADQVAVRTREAGSECVLADQVVLLAREAA